MVNSILNYFEYDRNLAAGGQPTVEQIHSLHSEGVNAIVNISPASTKNYLPSEAHVAELLGLIYVHFPVDCSNLKEHHYTTFKNILNSLNGKKVFVHCGGNIKSSNLIHMYRVLELGEDETESFRTLQKIQDPEIKWDDYFKSHGMQGFSCIDEMKVA